MTIHNFDLENVGQGQSTTFEMVPFDGKYIKIYKSRIWHFAPAHGFLDVTFATFYLEKVGQSNEVLLSKWRDSVAEIKIYKSRTMHFCANSYHFRDIDI